MKYYRMKGNYKVLRKTVYLILFLGLLAAILFGCYLLSRNEQQLQGENSVSELNPQGVQDLQEAPINSPPPEDGAETALTGISTFPGVNEGDYVDIRIIFPNGENYVVLSKKQMYGIRTEGGESIYLFRMTAKEQLWYSSAKADLKSYEGACLTAVRYTSGGQEAAAVTYLPNCSVLALYSKDENVTEKEDVIRLTQQRTELEQRLADAKEQ